MLKLRTELKFDQWNHCIQAMNQVPWLAGHHPRGTFFNLFPPGCELLLPLHNFTHLSTVNHCNIPVISMIFREVRLLSLPNPWQTDWPRVPEDCPEDCNTCEDAAVFSCLDATLCCQAQRRAKAPNFAYVCKYIHICCMNMIEYVRNHMTCIMHVIIWIVYHQWPVDLATLQNPDACSECKKSKFLSPDLW